MKNLIITGACSLFLSSSLFGQAIAEPDTKKDLSPVEMLETLQDDVVEGNLTSLLDNLPKAYQSDIESTIDNFAGKMDPQMYQEIVDTLNGISGLLKNKKGIFLDELEKNVGEDDPEVFSQVKQNWDTYIKSLDLLLASDLKDIDSLKSIDLATSAATLEPEMKKIMTSVSEMEDAGDFDTFKNAKFELVEKDDLRATIKITIEGEPEDEAMVRIGERWLPEDMVAEWGASIKEINTGFDAIENMNEEQIEQTVQMLKKVQGVIQELNKADSIEGMQNILMGQMEEFGPLLMPLMMQMGQ